MRLLLLFFAASAVTLTGAGPISARAQDAADGNRATGSLKVRFVYGGPAVAPQPINVDKDVAFCGQQGLVSEKLLVNAENRGIKNVVFHVHTGRGGSELPESPPANRTHQLANDRCRFEPHVVLLQVGDSLKLTNLDTVGHNFNMAFFANAAQNLTVPPGGENVLEITEAEPAVIPVDCNIHPWMRAYVVALDHPYGAISDENGALEIKGLPAGQELVFRLHHEAAQGAIREVKIDGKATPLRRNLLRLTLQPGENDLGTITLDAASLAP